MKRSKILFWLLLSLIGFSSCEDAKDPIINSKALDGTMSFTLNQPIYAKYTLADANATLDMDSLTCVQPDYGFTAAVTYSTQVCFDSNFANGTFQTLATTVNGEKVNINVKEMDKAIIALYPDGALPTPVVEKTVYIRLKAFISNSNYTQTKDSLIVKPLYSNAISIKVTPYVLPLFPLTEVQPRLWFIVGLADGAWTNSVAGLGKSLIPLSVVSGNKYNNLTGDGEFVYTNYFKASRGFKLIRDYFDANNNWVEQWGMTGSTYVYKGGDNITVPSDGYYKVTLNSIDKKLKIEAASITPASYAKIGLIGNMADSNWATDINLSPVETSNNHVWYANYVFAANSECKFRTNADWATNWGGTTYPYGIGIAGGSNIKVTAGSYTVVFNDIDGTYYFIKK
jgi:starch-binding outer membrane protein SusE/F